MSSTQSPNPKNSKASSSEVPPLSYDDKLSGVDLMTGGLFDGAGDEPLTGRLTFGGDMAYDDFIPNQGQSQPRGTPSAGSNPIPGNMSTQQQSSGRSGKFQYKGNWDTPEIDRPNYSPHPRAYDTGASGHGRTSEHSSGHHKKSPAVSNTNRVVDNLGWSAPPQSSPAVIINVNNGPPQPTTWGSLLSSPAVDKPQGNWVVANEGTKGGNASQEKNVDQSQKSGMRSPLGSTDSKDYIGSNDNPGDWQDTPAMPGAWYGSYDQTHDNIPGPGQRSGTNHENKTSFDHSGNDHGFVWTNPNKQAGKNEHNRKSSLDTGGPGRYRLDTQNQDNSSTWNKNKNDPGPSWDFSGNHPQGNQDKSSTWGNNNNDPPPRWDSSGNHPQGNQKNSGIQQSNTTGWDSSTNQDQVNRNWSSNQESNTRQDGTWGSGNGTNQDQHQSWAGRVEDNSSWAQPVGHKQGKLVSTSGSKKSTKSNKRSRSSFSVHDKNAQPNSNAVEQPLCVPSNPWEKKPITASSAPALEVPQAQIPTLPTTNPGPAIPVAPLPKPYWDTWKHPQECSSESKPEAAPVKSPEPLEPLFSIPSDIAQRSNKSHQVHVSQPVEYVHKKLSPKYMDGFDKPYAVFVFNYRSKGAWSYTSIETELTNVLCSYLGANAQYYTDGA